MSTNAAAPLEQLLRTLVGRPHEFDQVTLDPAEPSPIVPELRGAEVDELLRDAQYEVLVDGNRVDYGGKQVWSQVHLTVDGLRWLGEWPPPALEHHAGPWEDGYFGKIVKPVLAGPRDNPPHHGLVIAPVWGSIRHRS